MYTYMCLFLNPNIPNDDLIQGSQDLRSQEIGFLFEHCAVASQVVEKSLKNLNDCTTVLVIFY